MSQATGKVLNWSTKPLNSHPVSQHTCICFQAGQVNAHRYHEPAGVVRMYGTNQVSQSVDSGRCKYMHLSMEAEVSKASAKAINWFTKP